MKKILSSSAVVAAIIAMLSTTIVPSQAATLRVPKQSFVACAVQNGIYCIESITVTTAQGKVVPMQWVPSGQAVPAQPVNNGISFAPVAKVIKGVVKENDWWTTQYIRDALISGTTTYFDISSLINTAEYPEIGARYDSTLKSYDITKPVDFFSTTIDCWDAKTNSSSKQSASTCYKGGVAAVNDGEVKFIFQYATDKLAASAAKDMQTATWIDLKPLATLGQQPTINARYDATAKTFSKMEPLYTPIWVTNNSLVNGWDVAGTLATLPTIEAVPTASPDASAGSATTSAGSATASPSASPSVAAGSGEVAAVTDASSAPDAQGVVPAALAPNEVTAVLPPVEAGRALTGRWTSPLWNTLGLGSIGYDGLFVDAKAANEFVNHLFIDVVPTLTAKDNKVNLAGQVGNKAFAVSLDSDIVISVKVRTGEMKVGVSVAVGVDTQITTTAGKDYTTLTVEGTAVTVPLAKTAADCTGEKGVAKANVRQFQTLIIVQNDLSGFGIDGTSGNMYVGSNGVCSLTTPTWDPTEKSFSWTTAAPHFAPDGTTVNLGFYKAVIPFKDAALLWGLTNPADAATSLVVSVTTEAGGSTAAISTVSAKNGNIIIDVSGFQYSRPKLKIKMRNGYKPSVKTVKNLPAPKYTITCALGATTKKIVGTAPKCPKGFKKVGARS
ncbi:MAG: hypothetical protein F2954_00700 [Actinobacteria bacterium]|uniref:Unannotated protein n=1 Tax=freshwater metagenome TaxID=449393 RepID=A0A6J7VU31_9ZZZZ|nr:hypothetical protein [Actinomycetota bacterium]